MLWTISNSLCVHLKKKKSEVSICFALYLEVQFISLECGEGVLIADMLYNSFGVTVLISFLSLEYGEVHGELS